MRRAEPIRIPLRPLKPDERQFIRDCALAGDPPRMIAGFTGREVSEIERILERQEASR